MRKQKGSETLFLLIFDGFWEPSCPSKTEPRRSKIDVERASKFDQFLEAFWNATFSAQEPPRRENAADRRSGRSRPEATGGGFRRGKTRTSENLGFGRLTLEGSGRTGRTAVSPSSTPTPLGLRIAWRNSLGHID